MRATLVPVPGPVPWYRSHTAQCTDSHERLEETGEVRRDSVAWPQQSTDGMARIKQTMRMSSGAGQPKPLNRHHPQYAQNALARFDQAAAFVVRSEAVLAAAGDADRATALQRVHSARRWRDHAEAEADAAAGRPNRQTASGAPPVEINDHDIAALRLPFPESRESHADRLPDDSNKRRSTFFWAKLSAWGKIIIATCTVLLALLAILITQHIRHGQ